MCQALIQLSQLPKRGILSFIDETTEKERDASGGSGGRTHSQGCTWTHSARRTFRDPSLTLSLAEDLTWKRHWFFPQSPGTGPGFPAPVVPMLKHTTESPAAAVKTQSCPAPWDPTSHSPPAPCGSPLSGAGRGAWNVPFSQAAKNAGAGTTLWDGLL